MRQGPPVCTVGSTISTCSPVSVSFLESSTTWKESVSSTCQSKEGGREGWLVGWWGFKEGGRAGVGCTSTKGWGPGALGRRM